MNPVAFKIFGLDIMWYGVLIGAGMILALYIAQYNTKYREIDYNTFLDMAILSLPLGILGARTYYVLFEQDFYRDNISQVFNIRQGGLAIHGGIILGLITVIIFTKVKKISFFQAVDVAAPSIVLAQAIGRWGNFFNQEAHGGEVSYSFIKHFPGFIQRGMHIEGVYYHPTFLYESLWNILVFVILTLLLRRNNKSGIVFFSYIGLYSLGRFFIEGLRTDSLMLGGLRVAQLVSLAGILLWLGFILFSFLQNRKSGMQQEKIKISL